MAKFLQNFEQLDKLDLRDLRTISIKNKLVTQFLKKAKSIGLTHFQEIFNFEPQSYVFLFSKLVSIHIDLSITESNDFLLTLENLINLQSINLTGPFERIAKIINQSNIVSQCLTIQLEVLDYSDKTIQFIEQSIKELKAQTLSINTGVQFNLQELPPSLTNLSLMNEVNISDKLKYHSLISLQIENYCYYELHESLTQLQILILKKTYIPVQDLQAFISKCDTLKVLSVTCCYSKPFSLNIRNHLNLNQICFTESEYRLTLQNLPKIRIIQFNNSIRMNLFQGLLTKLVIRNIADNFQISGLQQLFQISNPIVSKDFNYSLFPSSEKQQLLYFQHLRKLQLKDQGINPIILQNSPIQELQIRQSCLSSDLASQYSFSMKKLMHLILETEIASYLRIAISKQSALLQKIRIIARGSEITLTNQSTSLKYFYCISKIIQIQHNNSILQMGTLFLTEIPKMEWIAKCTYKLSIKLCPQTTLNPKYQIEYQNQKKLILKLFSNENFLPMLLLRINELLSTAQQLRIINFNIIQNEIPEVCISSSSIHRISLQQMVIKRIIIQTGNLEVCKLVSSDIGIYPGHFKNQLRMDKGSKVKKFQQI